MTWVLGVIHLAHFVLSAWYFRAQCFSSPGEIHSEVSLYVVHSPLCTVDRYPRYLFSQMPGFPARVMVGALGEIVAAGGGGNSGSAGRR
jgi:hypothetical protein